MKIPEKIEKWSKTLWRIIAGFAILLGVIVGYREFFGNQPNIFAQITSEINVLDINEPLRDLQIIFQGNNIQKENLNLRIYRVKIENNGRTNITQNDFDQSGRWGIELENGKVIETRLVDSNSTYISTNLSPLIENSVVIFNKIIFDKRTFFIVELLVLHDKETPPVLYRIGKIAGVQESKSEILTLELSEPFWATLFSGNWLVNVVRFVIYGVAGTITLLSVFAIVFSQQEKRLKKAQNPQPPQQPG